MNVHEHATKNKPETKPAQDEVAKKAYGIYLKEGRPQGRDVQNWLEAESKMSHAGPDHHAHMAADFRKRFWISLVLTLPILVLSPMLQTLVGLREAIRFPGDIYAREVMLRSQVAHEGAALRARRITKEIGLPSGRGNHRGRATALDACPEEADIR
jgi:hypothetical protein